MKSLVGLAPKQNSKKYKLSTRQKTIKLVNFPTREENSRTEPTKKITLLQGY